MIEAILFLLYCLLHTLVDAHILQVNGGADNINYVNIICTICDDGRKEYILLPCGHTTCEACAKRILSSHQPCPFCRKTLSGINRVFI